jgi:hypothetical protein
MGCASETRINYIGDVKFVSGLHTQRKNTKHDPIMTIVRIKGMNFTVQNVINIKPNTTFIEMILLKGAYYMNAKNVVKNTSYPQKVKRNVENVI